MAPVTNKGLNPVVKPTFVPTSPVTCVIPALVTGPLDENIVKQAADESTGAIGPVR